MQTRVFILLLLFVSINLTLGVPKNRRNLVRGRPVRGFLQKSLVQANKTSESDVGWTQYFFNKVDHFDANNTYTFIQRYWSNNVLYTPGAPVFIMLGGEAAEDGSWIRPGLEWTSLAWDHQAWVFLIEHRFYGESHPIDTLTTDSLRVLSSAQAIEDYAEFIRKMKVENPQIADAKWIAFGGSYSGNLAAWMRKKHPELIHGAVASSAPVQAQLDFYEYLEVVKQSISNYSPACGESVTAGFNQVASLLKTASGRQALKAAFNLCEDLNLNNDKQIKVFWETVYSPYMEIVQYSGDNMGLFRDVLTIKNAICRIHEEKQTNIMAKMQAVNNFFDTESGYHGCNDINYDNFVEFMRQTTYGAAQESRAWMWQTCTEFGYFQSTDSNSTGSWYGGSGNVPSSFYIDECKDIFGPEFNSESIAKSVAHTNAYYGGRDNINATNILFPNGIVDPWHAIGKLTSTRPTLTPILISDTAHCADMYGASNDDPPALKAARMQISRAISSWLKS